MPAGRLLGCVMHDETLSIEHRRARALGLRDTQEDMGRRRTMLEVQLMGRDIRHTLTLDAMWRVPRHLFVPPALQDSAYADSPLPIGFGQTISQPYIVALMMQLGRVERGMRALDIGTGSGWQAALLGYACKQVISLEIHPQLAAEARARLDRLGFSDVGVRCADGRGGDADQAPFDVILVAAAAAILPQALLNQLAIGGRLVIPVGVEDQDLFVIERTARQKLRSWRVLPVRFVPLLGRGTA